MKMHILLLSLISVISLQGMEKKEIAIGSFTCQNRRDYQEDRSVIERENNGNYFLGVFDGHGLTGGEYVSKKLKDELHGYFGKQQGDIGQRLQKACNEFNEDVCKPQRDMIQRYPQYAANCPGSTAIVVYIDVANSKLCFANVGDSRAVYAKSNGAIFPTKDHKPDDQDEEKRIQEAGGIVTYRGDTCTYRLNGLPMSRAFGDVHVGKGLVADPDITIHDDFCKKEFIILASDGLWDNVGNEEAVEFVNQYLKNDSEMENTEDVLPNSSRDGNDKLSYIAEMLARKAIKKGSTDNITVIVAQLGGNDSEENSNDQSDSKSDDIAGAQENEEDKSQDDEMFDAQVSKSWNLFPSFITKHPWMSGGIASLALLGGLICYLKYIR